MTPTSLSFKLKMSSNNPWYTQKKSTFDTSAFNKSTPKLTINLGSLQNICNEFQINYEPSNSNESIKTLLHTLTTLSTSRATEHRLSQRLEQQKRHQSLGSHSSPTAVEEHLLQIQRLHQALKLILNNPQKYVTQLSRKKNQVVAVSVEHQSYVAQVFTLLQQLEILPNDMNIIRFAQDTTNNSINNVRKKNQKIAELIDQLELELERIER